MWTGWSEFELEDEVCDLPEDSGSRSLSRATTRRSSSVESLNSLDRAELGAASALYASPSTSPRTGEMSPGASFAGSEAPRSPRAPRDAAAAEGAGAFALP